LIILFFIYFFCLCKIDKGGEKKIKRECVKMRGWRKRRERERERRRGWDEED